METLTDGAVGIVPIHKRGDDFLFCIVRHAAGHWGFPKGHKEPGESDDQAARRELREETGIIDIDLDTSKTFSEHYSFDRDGKRYEKEVRYFVGFANSIDLHTEEPFKKEITECKWLTNTEAKETLTFPESRHVLNDVWEYVRKHLE